jgi:hypothetical protein
MSVIDREERISKLKSMDNPTSRELRTRAEESAKEFKTSWLNLAQALYAISRDKLYEYWGYEKFEHYVEREIGMKKSLAQKLVKTYAFVEQQEPAYLKEEYFEERQANAVAELDAISVLRQAKDKKEITRQDYQELRRQVFDKARQAGLVRKDLTAIMKERRHVDPDEEREQRKAAALRRFINALRSFKKDMDSLKLVRADIIKKTDELSRDIESELE